MKNRPVKAPSIAVHQERQTEMARGYPPHFIGGLYPKDTGKCERQRGEEGKVDTLLGKSATILILRTIVEVLQKT